ncbi:MAG TPA: hypothetical protein VND19_09940 [Acetobacteraceae bacterium]|nr:hypothetical protein [Acetobacteraceae bacterium]
MRPRRLVTILANACAILLLGLMGVAVAGPSLVFGSLDLYGPELFSGLYTVDSAISGNWQQFPSDFLVSASLYAVQDLGNTLSLLNSYVSQLGSNGISQVVALPANNSLFASIPEPVGFSLLVTGVAAIAFVRRRIRRSPRA